MSWAGWAGTMGRGGAWGGCEGRWGALKDVVVPVLLLLLPTLPLSYVGCMQYLSRKTNETVNFNKNWRLP